MQKTKWGDVTLVEVEAERRLLANALLDLTNERFSLLSESCIPLYNFTTVYALLTGSSTSFVDSFVNHDSEVRYNPFFADRSNISLAQWRKGFQWFEMDRALALEVVSNVRRRAGLPHGRALHPNTAEPDRVDAQREPDAHVRGLADGGSAPSDVLEGRREGGADPGGQGRRWQELHLQ